MALIVGNPRAVVVAIVREDGDEGKKDRAGKRDDKVRLDSGEG